MFTGLFLLECKSIFLVAPSMVQLQFERGKVWQHLTTCSFDLVCMAGDVVLSICVTEIKLPWLLLCNPAPKTPTVCAFWFIVSHQMTKWMEAWKTILNLKTQPSWSESYGREWWSCWGLNWCKKQFRWVTEHWMCTKQICWNTKFN